MSERSKIQKLKTLAHFTVQSDSGDDGTSLVGKAAKDGSRNAGGSRHELDHAAVVEDDRLDRSQSASYHRVPRQRAVRLAR